MSEPTARRPERRRRAWRVGTPVVVLLCGGLLAVSAADSDGTDLRPGRYSDLASLTQREADGYQALLGEAERLRDEVAGLGEQIQDARVRRERREAEALRGPAGLEPVSGPGVSVLLSDAPREALDRALEDPDLDLNLLVVHQEDIQAVVNAMWQGGATAVTIQGQRVVTTTGIKCTGSAVTLQGVPYPNPYLIEAVGDADGIITAIDADPDIAGYRADAAREEVGVGWELVARDVEAPAFTGTVAMQAARPQVAA